MSVRSLILPALAACVLMSGAAAAEGERARHMVRYDNVEIDVVAEGKGPLLVLLPSRGRDSEDYAEVAADLAKAGFRVLRPQPRGMVGSKGPLKDISLHDLARDVAKVIEHENVGPAVIVGHAYGNWVARMTAVDHPKLVRGVVLAAAAAKKYPPELSVLVTKSGDLSLPKQERLGYMQKAFFAPGHDPSVWLDGWWPEASEGQRIAAAAVKQSDWWSAGNVPLLDLQAELDPFKPASTRNELKDEFGDRVTVMVVPNASHALLPEEPEAVTKAIAAWVKDLKAPAGQ
jgi:pimeloyl-ACP methyl ester carboxylesterase